MLDVTKNVRKIAPVKYACASIHIYAMVTLEISVCSLHRESLGSSLFILSLATPNASTIMGRMQFEAKAITARRRPASDPIRTASVWIAF
jgi:hypothetical protein